MITPSIGISDFIKGNTNDKVFKGNWEDVKKAVEFNFCRGVKGYRDGVLLIPIDPTGFNCPVMKLKPGDRFVGIYDKRCEGEDPRKKIWKYKSLPPAKRVNIILYRKDVLLETHDETTGADWDMIAVQALDIEGNEEVPMDPTTLMYNHFQLSGGTSTKMTAAEFTEALRKSLLYWKDRILIK